MAVTSFSIKPKDEKDIKEIKRYCEIHCLNFSAIVVELLKEWKKENIDESTK